MPKGICDPSPEPYNTLSLAVADGRVVAEIRWEWDGVSVYPDCDGPVIYVRIRNLSADTFEVLLPNARRPSGRIVTIGPGYDQTMTAPGALKNAGLETIRDVDSLNLIIV